MRVLFVDASNTCASARAEMLALRMSQYWRVPALMPLSAGTAVASGSAPCPKAPGLSNHTPRQITIPMVQAAVLILTPTRAAQAPVASVVPECRNKMLTIRQAGRWSEWMLQEGFIQAALSRAAGVQAPGGTYGRRPSESAAPMPQSWNQRARWIAAELDASRGIGPDGRSGRGRTQIHPDDLPDPHHRHQAPHEQAAQIMSEALLPFVRLVGEVSRLPPR